MNTSNIFGIFLCIIVASSLSENAEAQVLRKIGNYFERIFLSGDTRSVQHKRECGYQTECVLAHLCSNNNNDFKGESTQLDFRTLLFGKNYNNGCDFYEVCCSVYNKIPMPYKEFFPRGCGFSNPNGLEINLRNTNYGESHFGEFPWVVIILENKCSYEEECEYRTVAAGSLLAPNVVITSAHNIHQSREVDLMVRAGEWNTQTNTEPYAHENRDVRTKITHENFSKEAGTYDVALLILQYPFNLNHHIGTICLPRARRFIDYSRCVVMGWGKKNLEDPNYPHLLKRIQLPFVENSKCQEQLQKTRLGSGFQLHESFVCAGGEQDRDACFGDGGAPLVCPFVGDSSRFQLIGLVSWGVDCGTHKVPGVYANVRFLQQWIKNHLSANNIPITYYI